MTVLFARTSPEEQSIYIYIHIHRLSRDQSGFIHNSLPRQFRESLAGFRPVVNIPKLKRQKSLPPLDSLCPEKGGRGKAKTSEARLGVGFVLDTGGISAP